MFFIYNKTFLGNLANRKLYIFFLATSHFQAIFPTEYFVTTYLKKKTLFLGKGQNCWCTLVFPNSTSLLSPNLKTVKFPNVFFSEAVTIFFCELHAFYIYKYTDIIYVCIANLHGKSISGLGFSKFKHLMPLNRSLSQN